MLSCLPSLPSLPEFGFHSLIQRREDEYTRIQYVPRVLVPVPVLVLTASDVELSSEDDGGGRTSVGAMPHAARSSITFAQKGRCAASTCVAPVYAVLLDPLILSILLLLLYNNHFSFPTLCSLYNKPCSPRTRRELARINTRS